MAKGSKIRTMGSGNPILGRIKNLEARVDDHDRRLDGHDRELAEVDKDIAMITDMIVGASQIALRAHQRDRARLISRRRRSRSRPG